MVPEPEGLTPCSQKAATGLYPKQTESSSHPPAYFLKFNSDTIYTMAFLVASFLQALPRDPSALFSPLSCVPPAQPISLSLTWSAW
jgi:hypothetical protein